MLRRSGCFLIKNNDVCFVQLFLVDYVVWFIPYEDFMRQIAGPSGCTRDLTETVNFTGKRSSLLYKLSSFEILLKFVEPFQNEELTNVHTHSLVHTYFWFYGIIVIGMVL